MNRTILVFTLLAALNVSPVLGQEKDKKPWWNPFKLVSTEERVAGPAPTRSSEFFNGGGEKSDAGGFKIPFFGGEDEKKSEPKKDSPSMFTKVSNTSKKWWGNTVDFVNPFDSKPEKNKYGMGYKPQNAKQESGSGMFGWLWQSEETETPSSVIDFLGQPRPRPGNWDPARKISY